MAEEEEGPESLHYIRDETDCPTCGAQAGQWCHSNGVWLHLQRMLPVLNKKYGLPLE